MLRAISSLGSSGEVAEYIGQVATRTSECYNKNGAQTMAMCSTYHIARDDLTAVAVEFPNYYVATPSATPGGTGAETGAGNSGTLTASIEYPAGTFTQLTFSGATSGTIADNGVLLSDFASVNIPNGKGFWVRHWKSLGAGGGIVYSGLLTGNNSIFNEQFRLGTSGITDQTMGGTIVGNANGYACYPTAIIGKTKRRSFLLMGDSINAGHTTDTLDATGDVGELARGLGFLRAYHNGGIGSDRAMWWLSFAVNRKNRLSYYSDVICNYGVNDLTNSRTPTQLLADIKSIADICVETYGVKRFYPATLLPYTTSTDAWATAANQTATAQSANIATHSANIRITQYKNFHGFVDPRIVVEDRNNINKWVTDGSANMLTNDGLHPNQNGYRYIARSNVVINAVGL